MYVSTVNLRGYSALTYAPNGSIWIPTICHRAIWWGLDHFWFDSIPAKTSALMGICVSMKIVEKACGLWCESAILAMMIFGQMEQYIQACEGAGEPLHLFL